MFAFPLDSSYFRIIINISRPNISSVSIWPEIVGMLISNPAISKGRSGIPENQGLREKCLFAKVIRLITQARENCMSSLVADESATFEHMF